MVSEKWNVGWMDGWVGGGWWLVGGHVDGGRWLVVGVVGGLGGWVGGWLVSE